MPSSLIRQDVLPVGVGYLLVMGALGTGLWLIRRRGDTAASPNREASPATGTAGPATGTAGPATGTAGTAGPPAAWSRLIRRYLGTALGGYLLLMAVVILYYYGVARVGGAFIASAFSGCALLIALTTPVFLAAAWVAERRRRGRAADVSGSGRRPGIP
jgi:hypothetical protein